MQQPLETTTFEFRSFEIPHSLLVYLMYDKLVLNTAIIVRQLKNFFMLLRFFSAHLAFSRDLISTKRVSVLNLSLGVFHKSFFELLKFMR